MCDTKKIKELSVWDFEDRQYTTSELFMGRTIPDATPENMQLLMEKINELVIEVNNLKNK